MELIELSLSEMEAVRGGKRDLTVIRIDIDRSRTTAIRDIVIVRNNSNTEAPPA